MSERILRALMQLFAIIAKVDEAVDSEDGDKIASSEGRKIIQNFLKTELSEELIQKYLNLFDEFLATHHVGAGKKDGQRKRTSVNSVKILRICSQINEELTQRQKVIVLVRMFDFINSNNFVSEQEQEFVITVAESFNICTDEYLRIKAFIEKPGDQVIDEEQFMYVSSAQVDLKNSKFLKVDGLECLIRILRVESVNTMFFRFHGKEKLSLNGQSSFQDRNYIFNPGSTIRSSKSAPIYYSEVVSQFLNDGKRENLLFKVENVEYKFPNGKIGLHIANFQEREGNLLGVMGGSGSGKSTFMNILNGNYTPFSGAVTINGINVHKEKSKLEGVIGFVSQDDLLIEELSVFQNLYYNARLCFKDLSKEEVKQKVNSILTDIGLNEVSHLRVGSPLDKTISGGQRKRLNIALELIREPAVMFVDEPTSGLSSRDSENIMDLLKELALKGKLIFVVIHQPSSDIFKMFDKLYILDQGGYPIFDGDPIDAIVYFKTHIHHANKDERECALCGNVNPEQIFNIIESKVIDEYGNPTELRKITPKEWNKRFHEERKDYVKEDVSTKLNGTTNIVSSLRQFGVFFKRDVLSKLANRQYMLINFLEAPILALILSFFVKFYKTENGKVEYTFFNNENLPQYLFISVVVALFLGLTVAAEEIIKDKKILKRESFLNLSKASYLWSKICIMFIISAIQTAMFVLIGNFILEIEGMWWQYGLILFSTSCMANALGLNVSASFNSAKVIYIFVPLLIIPQLLFSGVIVKFDKLHPIFSNTNEVPWIGNLMTSRWAYEALAVTQVKDNSFSNKFFKLEQAKSEAAWKRDYWLPEMLNQLNVLGDKKASKADFEKARRILINEITTEEKIWSDLKCEDCLIDLNKLNKNKKSGDLQGKIAGFLNILKKQFIKDYNENSEQLDKEIARIGNANYQKMQSAYVNESLQDLVSNRTEVQKVIVNQDHIIQKDDPIYINPSTSRFLDAPFYCYQKYIFGTPISTYWANLIVIWTMTLILIVTLYFDIFKWFLDLGEKIKLPSKKRE